MADLAVKLREKAQELGFDAIGLTGAAALENAPLHLETYLAEGRHGDMGWMAERSNWRKDPQTLWPEARSIIALGANYGPTDDPLALRASKDVGAISVYARNRDYHDGLKKNAKALARWLVETTGAEVKVFVDTAPVMEKPLAAKAGLGWQGKHTNLVSRRFGSWLFLAEIFTTLELPADAPEKDHCGLCRKCLDVCPTKAITAPHRLDARLCISYLTIEHKGPIPRSLRAALGNHIYGCDDCLAICPWNRFASVTPHADFLGRPELSAPRLAELAQLDDASFRALFAKTPVKRIGRNRFIRNVLNAMGNAGDASLAEAALPHLEDADPVVRGAAIWALARLLDPAAFADLREARQASEPDPDAAAEWDGTERDGAA